MRWQYHHPRAPSLRAVAWPAVRGYMYGFMHLDVSEYNVLLFERKVRWLWEIGRRL